MAAWAALIVTTSVVNVTMVNPLTRYCARHFAQSFVVPTDGMEPTLRVGDSIMVERSAYRDRARQRHDIVVFPHPSDVTRDFVQRIVGMPGDVIAWTADHHQWSGAARALPGYTDPGSNVRASRHVWIRVRADSRPCRLVFRSRRQPQQL